MLTRKRVILSAVQKCEICEKKEKNPSLFNVELAQEYKVGKLWVNNALNTRQDIDSNILKIKASYFARQFSIKDFHYSKGWLGEFKKRYGLHQFKKQGEAASAPSAESIENDCHALQ
ncbi:hypothetical protein RCL_jg11905.t1 [Rhizophagus clarus]|uniref:HTH CENPB-type domain-containing protein n=1 Tax=Rhizophagus clarus TaxID=94130 RepID=A0A8H3L933_9GLOM|nr:hypothetical protein RCL_jg11905.t1 [Rhizophagus clarus]